MQGALGTAAVLALGSLWLKTILTRLPSDLREVREEPRSPGTAAIVVLWLVSVLIVLWMLSALGTIVGGLSDVGRVLD